MKRTLPVLALVISLLVTSCAFNNFIPNQATAQGPGQVPNQVYIPAVVSVGGQPGSGASAAKSYPPPAAATTGPTVTPSRVPSATVTLPPPTPTDPPVSAIKRLPPYEPHTGENLSYKQWQEWPVMPVVSQRAKEIYAHGMSHGNDPKRFSKIGDCQSIRQYFLGYFDDPDQSGRLGNNFVKLKGALENFAGSYTRVSMAVRTGFNVASVLSAINSDPKNCKAGEIPLECEFRIWNPSIVIISMETWTKDRPTDAYEGYLRQIVDYVLSKQVVPILATKADNLEGDHSINQMIARVAYEYDIPLWNFWRAVQNLPAKGLMEDGFHLTNGVSILHDEGLQIAWNVRNLTGLQVIDKVWRDLKK